MDFRTIVYCILLGWLFPSSNSFGQRSNTDSLLSVLQKTHVDTSRINTLLSLSVGLLGRNLDSSLIFAKEALTLAEGLTDSTQTEIKDEKLRIFKSKLKSRELARTYYEMGVVVGNKGDDKACLGYMIRALVLTDRTKDPLLLGMILKDIGITYDMLNDHTKALSYYLRSLEILDSLNNKRMIAGVTNRIGLIYNDRSDFPRALDYFNRSLDAAQKSSDSLSSMFAKNNIGLAYWNQGNLLKALDYYFKSLKDADELKDKPQIAITLSNIGLIYWNQKNYSNAFEYMFKALAIEEKLGNKLQIARNLGNISDLYNELGDYVNTINYNSWALRIREEINDKKGIALSYSVIADVNLRQGDSAWSKKNYQYANQVKYPVAIAYYTKALEIEKQVKDLYFTAVYLANIGHLQTRMGHYPEAERTLNQALTLSDSIGALNQELTSHQYLSEFYESTGNYRKAYEHRKAYTTIKDSLFNKDQSIESNRKTLSYEYDKKEALLKAEQSKKDALAKSEKQRQQVITYSIGAVLLLVFSLALLIYRSSRQKQKANLLLERKNRTIEHQKKLVEDKNHHITESIQYAKRIQEAILPEKLFEPGEVRDHFVYHLPKDIVSGDFYWRYKDGDDLFFAVVDCTGHGVPGAMMSLLGYDMLEYALKDKGIRQPALILNAINDQVMDKLSKSNPGGSKDGMDMTLCCLNRKTMTLSYAGAKNGLCVIQGANMSVLDVDKRSIGDAVGYQFNQHQISLQPYESVFLFSDGYADQKGGPDLKRYMDRRFRTLLQQIAELPCEVQKEKIETEFKAWKGTVTQRDDILVVGLKV
jgi:serine phosphatase RsbU (regulator of sigma subunit)